MIYSVYPSQDAAVLALQSAEIDYMLTPLGLARGFQEQLAGREDIRIIANPPNGIRYLGFNTRRQPMAMKEFRQAVSILTDKEYVTGTVLAGVADPAYTMVPLPDPAAEREEVEIKGSVSSPVDPAPRCRFYDRCPIAAEICEISDHPPLEEVGPKHLVACYRV